jgi:hypothetical protein
MGKVLLDVGNEVVEMRLDNGCRSNDPYGGW